MMKNFEDQEIPSNYFTAADIIKAIEELNMNKSTDEFRLCAEHLKFCKNEIAPYLTKLFNNIIETLKTPNTFKTGIIFPEAIPLNKTNIAQLESFHRTNLRHIQSLPQRTAIAAIYLLIGGLPIEAELHKKQLSFLHNLLSSNVQRVKDIIIRQMSVNYDNPNSFFSTIRELLSKYGLPPIHLLQESLPSKIKWKSLVTKQLNTYWLNTLKDEAESKSTLRYMETNHLLIGKHNPVWNIFDKTKAEVRKAIIKTRIVSRTFTLNSDRAKFNQSPYPLCQLCNHYEENISHFLLDCPLYPKLELHILNLSRTMLFKIQQKKAGTVCFNLNQTLSG
ncbi:unnamed protein product [Mytilus coruscus]|uniref:Reverse transcriptase zinc-binding domain-containing protein n=1 Tax=Mytilus coruscus TaxID=42192 RepID=A0A6J8CJH3_MYTCO|nr:unnamed protein product [Mytilus coruscus]